MKPAFRLCRTLLAGTSLLVPLGGCMVGPDYHRPAAIMSQHFKEIPAPPGWVNADPHYAELPKGDWWRVYNDPLLDDLESRVSISNQTIKADEAAYRQARALIDEARASLFPTVSLAPSVTRTGTGTASTSLVSSTGTATASALTAGGGEVNQTSYQLQGTADWDPDIWGQIRRQVEGQVAAAQVSKATLDAARLSIQATLATDYFELRYQDSLQTLLNQFVAFYEQSEEITRNQYNAGVATPSDLLQAQTQVATTKAQAVAVGISRAQYEHAIAVLTGRPPAELTIELGALAQDVPAVPVTLPSLLLQRRPDIAEAERAMEEEDAQIGVAIAAFFPTISLSAAAGYAGDPLNSLIKVANRSWSLVASATETLFEGGERTAAVRAARAAYDESVATYRQTVLTAFQGVEDELASLRILAQQAEAQKSAVDLANQAVEVALNQYKAGTAIYTTVITDQATALSNAETALQIQESRMVASVALIEELGGGWDVSQLPDKDKLQRDNPLLPSVIQPDTNG